MNKVWGSAVGLAAALALAAPAAAADMVEPFAPGLSNLELYTAAGDGLDDVEGNVVVGGGFADGVSLGVSLWSDRLGNREAGLAAMLTRAAGRSELDLWLEVAHGVASAKLEVDARRWGAGIEWSRPLGRQVPYLRLSAAREDGGTAWQPLAGTMLPVGRAVELHLELSGERHRGDWTVRLAVGPNLALGRGLELIPELALLRPADGREHLAASLGLIATLR